MITPVMCSPRGGHGELGRHQGVRSCDYGAQPVAHVVSLRGRRIVFGCVGCHTQGCERRRAEDVGLPAMSSPAVIALPRTSRDTCRDASPHARRHQARRAVVRWRPPQQPHRGIGSSRTGSAPTQSSRPTHPPRGKLLAARAVGHRRRPGRNFARPPLSLDFGAASPALAFRPTSRPTRRKTPPRGGCSMQGTDVAISGDNKIVPRSKRGASDRRLTAISSDFQPAKLLVEPSLATCGDRPVFVWHARGQGFRSP
jgi:hypothetical protein